MNKQTVIVNFIWRFLERFGAQTVTAVVSLVLARLLDPAVYGTVALVTVITGILQVFVDSGLANALIQKKDADDLDFSTVFYFNMAVCLVLYMGLFLAAPLIAVFYGLPELTPLVRVLGLSLIISGVKNVQQAYVSRNMLFKRFFFATLGGTLGAAVVGIWMAMRGYGAWALAGQWLFNNTVDTLILWLTVRWRPKRLFSLQRLKGLLSFGWKLLANNLMSTLYNNLRQLIIGKIYSTEDLAYYNRGVQFPGAIVPNINEAVNSVLLPTLSAEQDRRDTVRGMTRRATRISAYLVWPLMIGLAACGEALTRLLLTEKWLPCVPFLWIFCIDYAFWPTDSATRSAFKAMGRADVLLWVDTLCKLAGLAGLLLSVRFGVLAIAAALMLTDLLGQVIIAPACRTVLGYTMGQKLADILPSAALAGVMGLCVWSVRFLGWSDWVTLLVQIPLGAAVYVGGSYLLRLESFTYLLETLRQFLKRT